ncbi:MAG: cation-transporting P-type ATPase, partial [Steroidobacteraceae bacterium]|nr:cation-transporting P-type ATPase [Steroidobacteraceae bacterium]
MMPEHDVTTGLSAEAAQRALREFGPNTLPERPPPPFWRRLVAQLSGPLIYLLLFALLFDLTMWFIEGAQQVPLEALAI